MWKNIRFARDEAHPLKPIDRGGPIADMRLKALEEGTCMPPPIGCGKPIKGFKNDLARKEYGITFLCDECQEKY